MVPPARAFWGAPVAVLVLLIGVACGGGGDDDANSSHSPSTGGTAGGSEPIVEGPASRFAPFVEDLPGDRFEVFPPETFGISAATFGLTGPFLSAQQGDTSARDWGYVEGYNLQYNPAGLLAGVLDGGYYVTIQVHLFETTAGAHSAFEAYREESTANDSDAVSAAALGNESAAFSLVQGTVGNSDTVAVYHRFIFRRGNVVAVVQTYGADPFMTIDSARDIAVMIDDRVLGNTPAVEPTPIPSVLPGTS